MPYPEKVWRNEEIFRLIEEGEDMESVAKQFDLCRSRVYQIYNFVGRKKFSYLNLNYKEEKTHG